MFDVVNKDDWLALSNGDCLSCGGTSCRIVSEDEE